MILSNNELKNITGGGQINAYVLSILAAVGGAVTFLIGFVDGFFRPLKCN